MKITNNTTTYEVAEHMGTLADERDGRIMLGLLLREGYTDTDEMSDSKWEDLMEEACEIRKSKKNK